MAWTTKDGTFELQVPIGSRLQASGVGFTTLLKHRVRGPVEHNAAILVAPSIDISGRVIDESSTNVAGANLWIDVDISRLTRIPGQLESTELCLHSTRTDGQGQFAFIAVPGGPAVRLNAQHRQHGQTSVIAPAVSTIDLVVTMSATAEIRHAIRGVVVHSDGKPAPGSEVRLGENNSTTAREDGQFELLLRWDFEDADLLAFLPGHQPAIRSSFGRDLAQDPHSSSDVRLELGPPALAIEGRILDDDGVALAGWRVSLANGLEASLHKLPPDFVEGLVAPSNADARSDANGHFQLSGLRNALYVLRAHDVDSLVCVETEPTPAGAQNLVIRIPEGSTWPRIRGRVLAKDGSPVGGIRLTVQVFHRFSRGAVPSIGRSVSSDDTGTFELERVPRQNLMLGCSGEGILSESLPVPEDSNPLDLELVVLRTAGFRIVRSSPGAQRADALRVFASDDRPGFVTLPGGLGGIQIEIADIGSNIMTTSETVSVIVLYLEGRELIRKPVALSPGLVTELEM